MTVPDPPPSQSNQKMPLTRPELRYRPDEKLNTKNARLPTWSAPVIGAVIGGTLAMQAVAQIDGPSSWIVAASAVGIGLFAGVFILFLDRSRRK